MKIRYLLCLMIMTTFISAGSAGAETWHTYNNPLGYAVPDECYAGLGVDYPYGITPGDGFTVPVECPEGSYEKTNDTYLWALTEEGDSLWFSSAANVMCTTAGVFLEEFSYGQSNIRVDRTSEGSSIRIPCWVCEHGDSMVARNDALYPNVMDAMGDWRPSKVFRYIKDTGQLVNLTEQIYSARGDDGEVFDSVTGIRSAGSHNGVIFFAGVSQDSGIYMFAFNDRGEYLGYDLIDGRQIRKMIVVQGNLYTGIAVGLGRGQVMMWTGNENNPFSWQVVGRVQGSITELSEYVDGNQTRIVVNASSGLHVSPPLRWGRLFWWQAWGWNNVWDASVYEPDPIAGITYGAGAVAQLGEWMYWGTMHIPYHAYIMNAQMLFGGIDNVPAEVNNDLFYGTHRATTIWRGRNLATNPQIELVYGETHLGAWNGETFVPVETGWVPLNMPPEGTVHPYFGTPMGSSGFYNPYNNYAWTALSFSDQTGDHLFFGTMDQTLIQQNDISDLKYDYVFPENDTRGADLWRFSLNSSLDGATDTTAAAEFTNGAGNILQYGVRCLIASDDGDKIYLGMANMANLLHPWADLPGDKPRDWFKGGWELRELGRR